VLSAGVISFGDFIIFLGAFAFLDKAFGRNPTNALQYSSCFENDNSQATAISAA